MDDPYPLGPFPFDPSDPASAWDWWAGRDREIIALEEAENTLPRIGFPTPDDLGERE